MTEDKMIDVINNVLTVLFVLFMIIAIGGFIYRDYTETKMNKQNSIIIKQITKD